MVITLKTDEKKLTSWIKLLLNFYELLRKKLDKKFVGLVASSNPSVSLHDVNVVVVVKEVSNEVRKLVIDLARKAEESLDLLFTISSITLSEGDPLIDEFELYFSGIVMPKDLWMNLIRKFGELLRDNLNSLFVELIAPSNPSVSLHDVNVVVVVKEVSNEVRKLVIDLARKAEEELNMPFTISSITLQRGDPLVEEFKGVFK